MLLVAVTAVFLYGLYLQFANKNTGEQAATGIINFPYSDCQPELAPCSVSLGDRRIGFFLPKKTVYLQVFPVEISLAGFAGSQPDSVSVRFEMPGMNMAGNQVQLSVNNGHWRGRAMLPVCTSGRSDWQAVVDVKVKEKTYRAVFDFVVSEKANS